jgi:negative regulator of flagellin synthesis FlgM
MEIINSMFAKLDPYRTKLDNRKETAVVKGRGAASGHAAATQTPAGDKVSLSPNARLLTAAHAEVSRAPDVRQEMVDGIKERIAAGDYTIDPERIAERLLQSEAFLSKSLNG